MFVILSVRVILFMEQSVFYQLSIVLALAAGISLIFRALRQPLIIGYILTGFLAGPSVFHLIYNRNAFESFSQIGVTLLLFVIGLGLNINVVKNTGKPVLVTFMYVTLGVGSLAFLTCILLGFIPKEAIILAIAPLFSSTIVVVKSLVDKKEQSRLYGQLAIGLLLVEDIAATLALVFVSAQSGSSPTATHFVFLALKGLSIAAILAIAGMFVMPKLSKLFAKTQELLYVFALAWTFGIASLCWKLGFSIEIGALFAGVALAHLPYAQEMSTRLTPIRDFFIVLFFIGLGEGLSVSDFSKSLGPALALILISLFVKPLMVIIGLGSMGYTKQTSFKTAVQLSQISEFSLVFVVLANTSGLVDDHFTTIVTITAMVTIAISSYFMKYSDRLYRWLEKPLSVFERKETKKELKALEYYPLVLLGYHDGGYSFIRTFRQMKKRYVVIDYDPEVIEHLERQRIPHIYGDATDFELLNEIGVHASELLVSTITDARTNRLLVSHIMHRNKNAVFICHANSYEEAEHLYELGASYVILPHFIGSEHINSFIRRNGSNRKAFERHKVKHIAALGHLSLEN